MPAGLTVLLMAANVTQVTDFKHFRWLSIGFAPESTPSRPPRIQPSDKFLALNRLVGTTRNWTSTLKAKPDKSVAANPECETTRVDGEFYRQKYINCRTFARSYLSIHEAVLPAYEAYLLLNPGVHSLLDRPGYYRPFFVAVARSAYVHVVAGFPGYRLLPECGETQIACFVDKLPEPDARSCDMLLEIAWHHVLCVTPWRALSNQVLGTFYSRYFHAIPESVLANHGCFGSEADQRRIVGPKAIGSLSGISRKTLNRLESKDIQSPVIHLGHEALVAKHDKLKK